MNEASRPAMPDRLEQLERGLGERYAIERELGAGGMATVYLATDRKHNRPVAIKDYLPVHTDPPGARVYIQRYDAPEDAWDLVGITPLDSLAVPKLGNEVAMRVRIEADGHRTVELLPDVLATWSDYRGLLPLATLRLDREDVIPPGMVRIPGFTIADPLHAGNDSLRFGDFFMDRYEVTNREYKAFVDAGGYERREYWTEPFIRDGRRLSWEEAMAELADATGRPGPSTWRFGSYADGQDDHPVGGVSWSEAAAYARFVGKELPSTTHWGMAALRYGRETSWIHYPASNLGGTGSRPVGQDRAMNEYGLYDVAGNVREWNANPMEGGRVTRGGGWNDPDFQVGWLIPKPAFDRDPTNGFRLMRHFEEDTTYAHVTIERTRAIAREYRGRSPAGDTEYRIFRRLYDYDPSPLNARVEARGSTANYEWEHVAFDPPYEGRRAGAYIFLPRDARPPLQPILYWPGSGVLDERALDLDHWIWTWTGFITSSGRALVLPIYDGTFERDDAEFSITWARVGARPHTSEGREYMIRWIKDMRRTIDYLETRADIDASALGFYGFSWGGQIAPIALAVEPRIKAAVLDVGGLSTSGPEPLPEVEPFHFLPRVTTPVLMVNGRYDHVFPYETAQLPFFQHLGTAPEHKQHYVSAAAHLVPRDEMVRRALAWYDRYLGGR
jgi:eukaryotic-like serine/threonine-protein kinase